MVTVACLGVFAALVAVSFAHAQALPPIPQPMSQWPDAAGSLELFQRIADEAGRYKLAEPPGEVPAAQWPQSLPAPQLLIAQTYGLQWVTQARYLPLTSPDYRLTAQIWAFPDADRAFGAFSQWRGKAEIVEDIGAEAFSFGQELVMWYDRYVVWMRHEPEPFPGRPPMLLLAAELLARMPQSPTVPRIVAIAPRGHLNPASVTEYLPSEGQPWPMLVAAVDGGGAIGLLRIYRTDSETSALARLEAWRQELAPGATLTFPLPSMPGNTLMLRQGQGRWSLLLQQNEYVVGLLGVTDVILAEGLMRLIGMHIRTGLPM